MPPGLHLKPHHQAHRCDATTAPSPETRATELGSGIGDQRSVRSDQSFRCQRLASNPSSPPMPYVLPRPMAPPLRPPSRYFTLYFSLFFSLNLWVLLWSVDCSVLRERESSLSLWTNSLSLSLYNYSIYLPLVRTSFGLDPKTRLGSGPTSPNNEFVKRGRKN